MRIIGEIKKIDARFFVSFCVAWTLLLMFVSRDFSTDNLIYAIGEIHTYNPNVFNGNIFMGEGTISPRYMIDQIFNGLMHVNGGDWAGAALTWIYFGAFIQSIGIANIARRVHKDYQIIISAILTCMLAYCGNYLAGFSLIALKSSSIGVALAFAFLSISFVIGDKRNYTAAWIFASCSIICHIHEGIYCCAVIFIFALADSIIQKRILVKENKAVCIAVISLLLIVAPSMITDKMDISNADFVSIYAAFRHPHHLVPSSWGADSIYKTLWIDVGLLLLCMIERKLSNADNKKYYLHTGTLLVAAWLLAVGIAYVFTEIKPVAAVSTLFIPKSFKYVLLIALIWVIFSSFQFRERGRLLSCYLLIYCGLFASTYELKQIVSMFLFVCLALFFEDYLATTNQIIISNSIRPFADIIFFSIVFCLRRPDLEVDIGFVLQMLLSFKTTMASALASGMQSGLTIILVFFAIAVIGFTIDKPTPPPCRFITISACVCMIIISLLGRVLIYSNEKFSLINGEMALRASLGDDLYTLAEDFKNSTDNDAEFLANPDDTINVGWFQVVSERNCYVVYKVIPSSRCMVDDWYNRYLSANSFDEKTGEDIQNIMESSGIQYVLINSDNYTKLDELSRGFSVFLRSPSDSFRVYKLVSNTL